MIHDSQIIKIISVFFHVFFGYTNVCMYHILRSNKRIYLHARLCLNCERTDELIKLTISVTRRIDSKFVEIPTIGKKYRNIYMRESKHSV